MTAEPWFGRCLTCDPPRPLGPWWNPERCQGHVEVPVQEIDYPQQDRCSLTAAQIRRRARKQARESVAVWGKYSAPRRRVP